MAPGFSLSYFEYIACQLLYVQYIDGRMVSVYTYIGICVCVCVSQLNQLDAQDRLYWAPSALSAWDKWNLFNYFALTFLSTHAYTYRYIRVSVRRHRSLVG